MTSKQFARVVAEIPDPGVSVQFVHGGSSSSSPCFLRQLLEVPNWSDVYWEEARAPCRRVQLTSPTMSSSPSAPIRLIPADAERYARLRLRMLQAVPWAFGASPEEDELLDLAHLARLLADEHSAIFAIEAWPARDRDRAGADEVQVRPELLAAAGITRGKPPKFAHRARIWGVFVEPARRGRGMGRALMLAALEQARRWPGVDFLDLGVSESSPEALRLYESLGFEAWGREPEATEHQGRRYDEIHLTLRL